MLCLRKNICFHLWVRVGESYCCVYDIFLFCTHVQEDFEDTKGVIKIHKSQMYRQHKDYKEKDKRTNNDVQNTTQKTKDRAGRITQNRWHKTKQKQGDLRVFGGICGGHLFNVLCYALFFFGFY